MLLDDVLEDLTTTGIPKGKQLIICFAALLTCGPILFWLEYNCCVRGLDRFLTGVRLFVSRMQNCSVYLIPCRSFPTDDATPLVDEPINIHSAEQVEVDLSTAAEQIDDSLSESQTSTETSRENFIKRVAKEDKASPSVLRKQEQFLPKDAGFWQLQRDLDKPATPTVSGESSRQSMPEPVQKLQRDMDKPVTPTVTGESSRLSMPEPVQQLQRDMDKPVTPTVPDESSRPVWKIRYTNDTGVKGAFQSPRTLNMQELLNQGIKLNMKSETPLTAPEIIQLFLGKQEKINQLNRLISQQRPCLD